MAPTGAGAISEVLPEDKKLPFQPLPLPFQPLPFQPFPPPFQPFPPQFQPSLLWFQPLFQLSPCRWSPWW